MEAKKRLLKSETDHEAWRKELEEFLSSWPPRYDEPSRYPVIVSWSYFSYPNCAGVDFEWSFVYPGDFGEYMLAEDLRDLLKKEGKDELLLRRILLSVVPTDVQRQVVRAYNGEMTRRIRQED